jgi:acetylornithine deacetylase/succinyl-diaminopimelate desuccinylase-like protein
MLWRMSLPQLANEYNFAGDRAALLDRLSNPAHSNDEAGLRRMAQTATLFIHRIARGFPEVVVSRATDLQSRVTRPTVVMRWNDEPRSKKRVLLISHFDVVPFDDGPVGLREIRRDGMNFLRGRGTIDNGGNDLVLAGALRQLRQLTGSIGNVTVVLSGDEELTSPTSRWTIRNEATHADLVLGFEGAGPNHEWVHARLGASDCRVTFFGSSTHSVQPSPNSADVASRFTTRMRDVITERTGAVDEHGLPAFFSKTGGLGSSSMAANMSPESTVVAFTVRAREASPAELRALVENVVKEAVDDENRRYPGSTTPVSAKLQMRQTPHMPFSKNNAASPAAAWAHQELGLTSARGVGRVGGADIAFATQTSRTGYGVCGLGALSDPDPRNGPHTTTEAMRTDQLGHRMAVAALLIAAGQGRSRFDDIEIPPNLLPRVSRHVDMSRFLEMHPD